MEIEFINVALVPLVLALVAVAKKTGLASRYAPLLSVVLGVLAVLTLESFVFSGLTILIGIGTGLAASGLFSGTKATVKG
jgi:hydrogenase-4 membrane subunit HyfE